MANRRKNLEHDDEFVDPIDELDHPKQRAFLAVYQECCSVIKAARASKIPRSQHYYWRDNHPAYARAFESAKRQAADILESAALERAVVGEPHYLYQNGKPVLDKNGDHAVEYKKSDQLLICLLKATLPEKYRDNYQAPVEDDGVRIAGRNRADVIREEIEARQKALDMIVTAEKQRVN